MMIVARVKLYNKPMKEVLSQELTEEQVKKMQDDLFPDESDFKRVMVPIVLSTDTAWAAAKEAQKTMKRGVSTYSVYRTAQLVRIRVYEYLSGVGVQWWYDELLKNGIIVGMPPEMVNEIRMSDKLLPEGKDIERLVAARIVDKEE